MLMLDAMGAFKLLSLFLICCAEALPTTDFYTAAVLEHVKVDDTKDRTGSIARNLHVFEKAAMEAASLGADIIVYPEEGILPSSMMIPRSMKEYYEVVPEPRSSLPCHLFNKTDQPVLANLCSIAKAAGIYIVANVGEKELCSPQKDPRCPVNTQALFYNTDVVFDSSGFLVARHRKRFLFFEPYITRPLFPEYTVFNTSFGSFGVIICFDSVFSEAVDVVEKFKVENIIISARWSDELPLVSAIQYFQGWALGNRVNVLAANLHQPSTGTIGSLIVSGIHGTLDYSFKPDATFSQLLVARVPRTSSSNVPFVPKVKPSMGEYKHSSADLRNYTLTKLEKRSGSVEACNNGLCCNLEYKANSNPDNFYLGAFKGIRDVLNHYHFCQEVCILVLCSNGSNCTDFPTQSAVSFESVSLTGNINTPYQYPSVLTSLMTLVPKANWYFSPGHVSFSSRLVADPLLSVSIYGRCYDQDPPFPDLS